MPSDSLPLDPEIINDVLGVLKRSRDRIVKNGWCQKILQDQDGRYCIVGSLAADSPFSSNWYVILLETSNFLSNYLPRFLPSLSAYNDAENRTEAEIIDLFDRAIASIEEKRS